MPKIYVQEIDVKQIEMKSGRAMICGKDACELLRHLAQATHKLMIAHGMAPAGADVTARAEWMAADLIEELQNEIIRRDREIAELREAAERAIADCLAEKRRVVQSL